MGINTQDEANDVINQAYKNWRNGLYESPGKDPALLSLLNDIKAAEARGPEAKRVQKELEDVRLSLQYPRASDDTGTLRKREQELQSRLSELSIGQGVREMAFEVRSLLRDAGEID